MDVMDTQAPGDSSAVEYDALWQQVRQQSGSAFEQWVNLIKFVKDISKVREVFDDFLAKYPLCYGYWMQYVGAEVSSGDKCADVLERGVAATPYSIELWLYYIDRLRKGDASVDDVRKLFSRAAQYVSIDWNAHRLLDKWLEYESSQQDIRHMADIYMMAIALPMKELQRMYASFTDFASQHALSAMVSQEAIDAATLEAKHAKLDSSGATAPSTCQGTSTDGTTAAAVPTTPARTQQGQAGRDDAEDAPPGAAGPDEAPPPGAAAEAPAQQPAPAVAPSPPNVDHIEVTDEEVKGAWLERHRRTYEATRATADARSGFEMRIKRRWWHYKPLDPEQLLTWWLYLDSVQGEGDEHVTYGLFERCLVPCASYPEFWSRYLCFLHRCTSLQGLESVRSYALSRAARIFCAGRPDCLLTCALLHEINGEIASATEILDLLNTSIAPRSLECVSRHANFQRRINNGPRALELIKALLAEFRTAGDEATVVWLAQLLCVMEVAVERGGPKGLIKGEQVKIDSPQDNAAADKAAGAHKKGTEVAGQSGGGQMQERGGDGGSAKVGGGVHFKDGETTMPHSDGSSSATVDIPEDGSSEAELTQVLATNPSNEGAWSAAITAIELKYFGAERAAKVLMICRQAVSATVPQAGGSTGGTPTPALPFATREAHIASALAAMDLYGTPQLMWEVIEISVGMQGEVLQQAVHSHKRPAAHDVGQMQQQQPDAKRQMTQHPSHAAADAHAQYYQQQGYDYSNYYQQQAQQQQQMYYSYGQQ